MKLLFLLIATVIVSCQHRYVKNEYGMPRPLKPQRFRYYNKGFQLHDPALLDTNAIYMRIGKKGMYGSDTVVLPTVYYRFWANGRALEVYPGNRDLNSIVNNTALGEIGYYHIRKGRLKMEMFETLNGGQTSLRFGYFDKNGDIWFYDQRPEMYYGSWPVLAALEGKEKTRWVKTKVDSLKYVKPDW